MSKSIDEIRLDYINNKTLQIGSVLSNGLTVIDRRSNYVICEDTERNEVRLFVSEAYNLQTEQKHTLFDDCQYIPNCIVESFESITTDKNYYNVIHAVRAVNQLFESAELETDNANALHRAQKYLTRLGICEEHNYLELFEQHDSRVINELKHKAISSGISLSILKQVYYRGKQSHDMLKHNVGVHQHAMDRVSNFIKKAKEKSSEKHSPKAVTEENDSIIESTDYEKMLDDLENNPEELEKLADKIHHLHDIINEEIQLDEHISRQERIRRKITFKKNEPKEERGREIARHKLSSPAKIKIKARKAAVELLKEKIAKKGLEKMSISEKERLEDMIAKRKDLVNRLAAKLAPKIRNLERERIYGDHLKEEAGPKGERSASADKEEEVIDVNGHQVIVSRSPEAVYSDGGVEDKNYVSH